MNDIPLDHEPTSPEKDIPVTFQQFVEEHPEVRVIREQNDNVLERRKGYHATSPDRPMRSDIEGFIGAGYEKAAYLVDNEFVVKILNRVPHRPDHFIADPSFQIQALQRGIGVAGLEQIVTADQKEGVIVTEFAKGCPVTEISSSKLLRSITKEHLAKLETTLKHMTESRIEFDNAENVFFDPEEGFTIVDYRFGISPNSEVSTDPDDFNYSPAYVDFLKTHTLSGALDMILGVKKKSYQSGEINTYGEELPSLRPTVGRFVIKKLVKLKS